MAIDSLRPTGLGRGEHMGESKVPGVAVVGCGYWGRNLVRNFWELGGLTAVCDVDTARLAEMQRYYSALTAQSFEEVLTMPQVSAVAIAAPAAQHFSLAKKALLAGKDAFVEKPLALRVEQGEELVELAQKHARVLMVGHLLHYHPAVTVLRRLVQEGELGKVEYISSSRLNLGKLRTEENILWSFAPHDISAILYLLGESPVRVSAHGGSYLNPQIFDTTLTTCEFRSGVKAHIFVSWLHPFKEQKLAIVGSKKMAVFDDVEPEHKLTLYSHRIDWLDRMPVAHRDNGQVVPLPREEPLRRECEHFLDCVRTRQAPRTDGESGVQVLEVLEACEHSLRQRGLPVEVAGLSQPYYAHSSAIVDEG